mmetsp:Transcript_7023/g.11363  ORF Transcript_7023/g.11363 Transcript_7023/m.11363 type:complete len:186 (+) Transcript_7023:1275-1832(+)
MTAARLTYPLAALRMIGLVAVVLLMAGTARAEISAFLGSYTGSAEVTASDGTKIPRDMSVEISETKEGFRVKWTSVTLRTDGRRKEKSYTIDFVPSDRDAVYAAAMRRNVFGHEVQLNPMKGEPYVWSRIDGETLTVYSLFVDVDGGYSLQQYDRTLADGGLNLRFQTIRDGEILRAVETFLTRS